MILPHVTALYAGLLGFGLIVLSLLVIRNRYRTRAALGTGGDARLERAIRVHGNFVEYVPMALVLLLLAELLGRPGWLLHGCGAALCLGRALHAVGVSQVAERMPLRSAGMGLTFAVLTVLAAGVLLRGLGWG